MPESKRWSLVSIVILNFNGKNYLEKCISSVLETNYPNFEVILVDNASTDGSVNLIEQSFGSDNRLKIIRNNKNSGFADGNNVGFSNSNGSYIAFLNSDTIVDKNWLTIIINAFNNDKTIGLAQSLLLRMGTGILYRDAEGSKIDSAGVLLSDYLSYYYAIRDTSFLNNFQYIYEVSSVSGAAMIVDRKICDRMGLFDPLLPFYYDDLLLSLKTWLAGKRVVIVPQSVVYHIGSEATRSVAKGQGAWYYFCVFHGLRGKICLIFDVYERLGDLMKALFIFGFSLFEDLFYHLQTKNIKGVSAQTDTIKWVLRNFGHIWRNRLTRWSNAKISPDALIAKFIRINLSNQSIYILPFKRRGQYLLPLAKKYENSLIQSAQKS